MRIRRRTKKPEEKRKRIKSFLPRFRLPRFHFLKKGKISLKILHRKLALIDYDKIIIILLSIWLATEIALPFFYHPEKKEMRPNKSNYSLTLIPEEKSFSEYEKAFGKRELFQPSVEPVRTGGTSAGIVGMAEDLSLVGIISVGEGKVATIRDKKSGKSYLCQQGDVIKDLKVEEVSENKAILSYEGEKIELGF